jgi:hypothetical protein
VPQRSRLGKVAASVDLETKFRCAAIPTDCRAARSPDTRREATSSFLAQAITWLAACYRRSRDRHRLSQLDAPMRTDLRQDRVQAELAKRSWQA